MAPRHHYYAGQRCRTRCRTRNRDTKAMIPQTTCEFHPNILPIRDLEIIYRFCSRSGKAGLDQPPVHCFGCLILQTDSLRYLACVSPRHLCRLHIAGSSGSRSTGLVAGLRTQTNSLRYVLPYSPAVRPLRRYDRSERYARGLTPNSVRNARLKFDTSPKPQSRAMSITLARWIASRVAASRRRARKIY